MYKRAPGWLPCVPGTTCGVSSTQIGDAACLSPWLPAMMYPVYSLVQPWGQVTLPGIISWWNKTRIEVVSALYYTNAQQRLQKATKSVEVDLYRIPEWFVVQPDKLRMEPNADRSNEFRSEKSPLENWSRNLDILIRIYVNFLCIQRSCEILMFEAE